MNSMLLEAAEITVITIDITLLLKVVGTKVSVTLFKLTMMLMRNMAMMIRIITEMEWE
jgi:hypothetical protein